VPPPSPPPGQGGTGATGRACTGRAAPIRVRRGSHLRPCSLRQVYISWSMDGFGDSTRESGIHSQWRQSPCNHAALCAANREERPQHNRGTHATFRRNHPPRHARHVDLRQDSDGQACDHHARGRVVRHHRHGQEQDPGQRRHPVRPAADYLRGQAARGREHARRLQHSEGVDAASRSSPARRILKTKYFLSLFRITRFKPCGCHQNRRARGLHRLCRDISAHGR
jgi:hypothetical protein